VDFSVKKNFRITERFSSEFQVVFTNFFNHDQFGDPSGDYLIPAALAVSDRRRDSFTATARGRFSLVCGSTSNSPNPCSTSAGS